MDAHHLQELIDLEEGYWWHVAKRRWAGELLQRYLPAPGLLIEGGIGSGRNLLEFQRLGYEVAGLEIMPESVAHAHQAGLPNVQLHDLAEPWPVPAGSARAVVMLDVLEHITDPILTLRYAAAALRDDGGLVLTVPAYPSLYSDWDRQLGHYRRYTWKELLRQAAAAGLAPAWHGCWNAFSLPPAVVSRKLPRRSNGNGATFPRLPGLLNRLLMSCASAERIVSRWIRIPVGLSLMGVFVKPEGANRRADHELASS